VRTAPRHPLLQAASAQPERISSRERLLDLMHADLCDVTDRTVDSHVRNLRHSLEDVAPGQSFIHSDRCRLPLRGGRRSTPDLAGH
jgi:two-component system response regulator BaeR